MGSRLFSLVGSMIGNACEWYDYVIYGSLAPILPVVFFADNNKSNGLLLTFLIFAVGFLVRPIGGLAFGHISDKYGRKKALVCSVMLMAIPALAISFLPSYASIGILSPCLLLVFRLFQGVAIGGEYPIMVTYLAELAPPEKRGFVSSFANVTTVVGVLFATITVAIITEIFSHEDLIRYGWRIPFFISFLTILFGYYIRFKLPESPVFLSTGLKYRYPLVEAFKAYKMKMSKIFCYTICIAIGYYTFNVFSITYLHFSLRLPYLTALYLSMISVLFLALMIPLVGWCSDRYGRKKIAIFANLSFIIFIFPVYVGLTQKILWLVIMSQLFFAFLISLYLAPLPSMMVEQVSAKVRSTTISVGYNFALAIFGGTAPLINIFLIKYFHSNLAPSIYLLISAVVSLASLGFMEDLTKKTLI